MSPIIGNLDEIIASLDPEDIPYEYILMAKVTDFQGNEKVYRGKDLGAFLSNPFSVAEVKVILDVRTIRLALAEIVRHIATEVAAKRKG